MTENGTVLILGFFDGIHLGHRSVIDFAVSYGIIYNAKPILLTFPKSPAEFFNKNFEYIYPREFNYQLIKDSGVEEIAETEFSELADIEAEEYIRQTAEKYSPIAIVTGFNYTFGKNRLGTPAKLRDFQEKYNYKYFCVPEYKINDETVCSSKIREYLKNGDLKKANLFLEDNYTITSTVIKGNQVGRTIGFPTANLKYPDSIIKLPYGVYKAKALGRNAMVNWGVKPTLGKNTEVVEVHILDFNGDLYGQELRVEFAEKIRDEKKFNNLDELKNQIEKDKALCLK